jgi:pimeloyl-ACP methyl ester carboxylesterase
VKPKKSDPESEIPFVLIPTFVFGVAVWSANLDALAEKRTVHAFDTLGFGRSGRPDFSDDPTLAEYFWIIIFENITILFYLLKVGIRSINRRLAKSDGYRKDDIGWAFLW